MWKRCLTSIESTDTALVFGLGDYLDWTRTTHRLPMLSVWGEDDKARQTMDEMVMEQLVYPFVDTIRKVCPSFKDKCVGLVEGNHHGTLLSKRFANGRTTTEEICQLLGVRYLGLSAWVRVTGYRSMGSKKPGTALNLNVLLNHSVSSSGKLATSLAAAQRKLEGWRNVDVFLSANDHQLGHVLRQELSCTQRSLPRPMECQQVIGKVGSFQKGYQEGSSSTNYVEKKLLHPGQLGWLAFTAHVYSKTLPKGSSRTSSPEVWRFSDFNV